MSCDLHLIHGIKHCHSHDNSPQNPDKLMKNLADLASKVIKSETAQAIAKSPSLATLGEQASKLLDEHQNDIRSGVSAVLEAITTTILPDEKPTADQSAKPHTTTASTTAPATPEATAPASPKPALDPALKDVIKTALGDTDTTTAPVEPISAVDQSKTAPADKPKTTAIPIGATTAHLKKFYPDEKTIAQIISGTKSVLIPALTHSGHQVISTNPLLHSASRLALGAAKGLHRKVAPKDESVFSSILDVADDTINGPKQILGAPAGTSRKGRIGLFILRTAATFMLGYFFRGITPKIAKRFRKAKKA